MRQCLFWRFAASLLLLLLLPGAHAADDTQTIGKASSGSDRHEQGRAIYNYRCYFCHGYSGDAKTLTSTYLNPKPRDFTALSLGQIRRDDMLHIVKHGRAKTAMAGFANILDDNEIELVVDFVRAEFIRDKKENTRYHTLENGWPNHQRYANAFPFATGAIPIDTPWEALTPTQQQGKRRFLSSCISCHDRANVNDEGPHWESTAVSFPLKKNPLAEYQVDAVSGASVFAQHDRSPQIAELSDIEQQGKKLYIDNCAFCHAADGTGRNWIGSFLEPHPRDLTDPVFINQRTRQQLLSAIQEGLPGTTMPAWKSVLSQQEIKAIIAYIERAFKTQALVKQN